MSKDSNGNNCRHNITETDELTNEEYCIECGDVVEENTEEDY